MASRLGVGIAHQWEEKHPGWTAYSLANLGEPFWYNWKYDQIAHPRYNPMLFRPDLYLRDGRTFNPHWEASAEVARQYGRTKLWLLGNELELSTSAEMSPYIYWKRIGNWIEKAGPPGGVALVAAGGGVIVNMDKGKQWFQEWLGWYGPKGPSLDRYPYFHVHIYFADTAQRWIQEWEAFKSMCGPHFRPTVISETNLYNAPVDEQKRLMDWIVANAGPSSGLWHVHWYTDLDWFNTWSFCKLREENGTITSLGQHFRSKQ